MGILELGGGRGIFQFQDENLRWPWFVVIVDNRDLTTIIIGSDRRSDCKVEKK